MRRSVRTTADRYGELSAHVDWKVVLEHYHWDRVIEAHRLALDLGASFGGTVLGTYRMVEGEAITRERGQVRKATEWLQLETIDSEVDDIDSLQAKVLQACDEVGSLLGWEHEHPAMVSVLSREADAPWHGSRFGYFVDKFPYDKICIPLAATVDDQRLHDTLVHEYTHLVVLNRTEGRTPDWLQEALAMLVEGEELDSCAYPFQAGHAQWLPPDQLERAFHAERREAASYGRVWHAYQQAAVLGHFLLTRQGWEGIHQLLSAFANNTFWQDLKLSLTGEPSVDEALKEVFAFTTDDLFQTAGTWIKAPL